MTEMLWLNNQDEDNFFNKLVCIWLERKSHHIFYMITLMVRFSHGC